MSTSGSPSAVATPTTDASTTTTAKPTSDDEQIRAVLNTYWSEWTQALADPDPERSALLTVLDGQAREAVVEELAQSKALGEVSIRSDPNPMPHKTLTITVTGDTAVAQECAIDDTVTIERTTRSTIDARVDGLLLKRTLTRLDGRWLVTSNERVGTLAKGETCDR